MIVDPGQLFSYALTALTMAMGTLLIYSGVVGTFIDPLGWAKGFGLPNATAETVTLFPSATGRNLGAGCFVWAMILLGDRKTLGLFIACWSWAGVADCKILLGHPDGQNLIPHMRNTATALVLGVLLMRM